MTVPTRRIWTIATAGLCALLLAACGSSSKHSGPGSGGSSGASLASAKQLVGAGSTLVAPMMSQWEPTYDQKYGVAVTYGAIGSGGGIESITGRSVTFGASDAPLTSQQAAACKGCLEIPWALAATDVAYHVQGVPNNLKLTGPVLANIFMGKITSWKDPAIQKLNPGVKLPATKIVPVHRTDGSGDTYAFTNYLSHVDPMFRSKIGAATSVNWPSGVGGKGNSGVGGVLQSTNGAIAYIAIAYVLENKFDYALVQNAAGKYPTPGVASISAAAKAVASVPKGGTQGISLVDPPASAPGAYPISTFTYVLVPRKSSTPAVARALRKFIGWAITAGQASGPKLDFAPLPAAVVSADKATLGELR